MTPGRPEVLACSPPIPNGGDPLPPGFVPWTITRAEWFGQRARLRRRRILMWASVVLFAGIMSAAVIGGRFGGFGWFAAASMLVGGCSVAIANRWTARLERALDRIWDEHGCACPQCFESVLHQPCPRHGLGPASQPDLVALWEATATNQLPELMQASHRLREQGWIGWQRRMPKVLSSVMLTMVDPKAGIGRRLGVAIVIAVVLVLPVTLALRMVVPGLLGSPVWLVMPLLVVLTPSMTMTGGRGRNRCAACGQELADAVPAACPECNAGLSGDGAVTSVVQAPRAPLKVVGWFMLFALAPLLLMVGPMWVDLPPWLGLRLARVLGPQPFLYRDLATQQLTSEEYDLAASIIIESVEADPSRSVLDWGFLGNALAAGTLPESWAKRMATSGVRVSTEALVEDGTLVVRVTPSMPHSLFVGGLSPHLVLLAATIDGQPMQCGTERAFDHTAVDPGMRRAIKDAMATQLPAVQAAWKRWLELPTNLEARMPLAGLVEGEHRVELKMVVVVTAATTPGIERGHRWQPAFDGQGALLVPDDARVAGGERVYPFDQAVTITLPLR